MLGKNEKFLTSKLGFIVSTFLKHPSYKGVISIDSLVR